VQQADGIFVGIQVVSDAIVLVILDQMSVFRLSKPFSKGSNRLFYLSILHNWRKWLKEGAHGRLLTKR
jgi:hypothetical protein